jgi:hypothetical protein
MSDTLEVTIQAREVPVAEVEDAVAELTADLDLDTEVEARQSAVGEMETFGVGIVIAAIIRWAWPIVLAKVLEMLKGDLEGAVEWLYKKLKELIAKIGDRGDIVLEDSASGKRIRLSSSVSDDALKEFARPGFFDRFNGPVIAYDADKGAWVDAA